MGMLATVMNALALQNSLEKIGVDTRVLSAIPMATVSEPYIRRRAVRHMEKGRVVIFAAGTGNPFFTTDTAAALRAAEMGCDALFKGTSVDGVYDADPKKVKGAKRYETVGFNQVLSDDLKVMDASAIALCRDNNIPIVVFNIRERGNLARVLGGGGTATIVSNDPRAPATKPRLVVIPGKAATKARAADAARNARAKAKDSKATTGKRSGGGRPKPRKGENG